jgi:hypothetical protein
MEAIFKMVEMYNEAIREVRKDFDGSDDEFEKLIEEKGPKLKAGLVPIYSSGLVEFYKKDLLISSRDKSASFKELLLEKNKDGFDYLEIILDLNRFLGKKFLKHFEDNGDPLDKLKLSLTFRLHARACQVATEVKELLSSGYSDGAHARWRTLHEISVIFLFLMNNDTNLAQMYFDFQAIEKFKRAKLHEKYHEEINWKPLETETYEFLENRVNELKVKYGKDYGGKLGWTKNIIQNKGDRHFSKIEELVGLSYMRPFYSWASENVHSGVDSITTRMGLPEVIETSYQMFGAPTMIGLTDPAQFTCHSLNLMSSALLSIHDNVENAFIETMLADYKKNMTESFARVQEEIKEEIKSHKK